MSDSPTTKERQRSPRAPAISLEQAVEKLLIFYKHDRGQSASAASLAEHWGLSPSSSTLVQNVASLKQYGLVAQLDGLDKALKPTPRGLQIAMLDENDPLRTAAIKEAALNPPVFRDLWKAWGSRTPSDRTAAHYLVSTMGFNAPTAAEVIRNYKATISFANIESDDKIGVSDSDKKPVHVSPPIVGDLVQWVKNGLPQFDRPMRVLAVDNGFGFVEDQQEGIPVDQLTVEMPPPLPPPGTGRPPANPYYKPPAEDGPVYAMPLPRDNRIEIRLRTKLTPDEFKKFLKAFRSSAFGLVDGDLPDEGDDEIDMP